MPAADAAPLSAAEAARLFALLSSYRTVALAVSGGPDSMALLHLAARWRGRRKGPALHVFTVDHGLRRESAAEARAVAAAAEALGLPHRRLLWRGEKPKTGIAAAARAARYRLLDAAARRAGAEAIVTAHTLDDQAETVLFRAARGSGLTGLTGMEPDMPLPGPGFGRTQGEAALRLVRPFLSVPKARLLATLARHGIDFAQDPSNADPRFARARFRALMPALSAEGLDAAALARLAGRLRRADAAIEAVCDRAALALAHVTVAPALRIELARAGFSALPEEIRLRLVGRAVRALSGEAAQLARLEALCAALDVALAGSAASSVGKSRFRRTLGGCLVTLEGARLTIERAPPRRNAAGP